jgi:hypothetical protein
METNGNGQPFTWFVPEKDGEQDGSIPHRIYNGWVKLTRWNRQTAVVKVETVRLFGVVTGEIVYPPRPPGYPLFDDLFLGGRIECIPDDEAHAWLRAHGLPVPGDEPIPAPEVG